MFQIIRVSSLVCAVLAVGPTPLDVANRAIKKYTSTPWSGTGGNFFGYDYGSSIMASATYEAAMELGIDYTATVDKRLQDFMTNSTLASVGYKILNNITVPFTPAVGDVIGLYPIAFLSSMKYHKLDKSSREYYIATQTADKYILQFTPRLPDSASTFSRVDGWTGQPTGPNFVWNDDNFMGVALLARLVLLDAERSSDYLTAISSMQSSYESYVRDPVTGLYFHGYDYGNKQVSCCFWSRANGWQMMSHVEVLKALTHANPLDPRIATVLGVFNRHATAIAGFQDTQDGRWHQVINDTTTFLETSFTAMNVYAYAEGMIHGWLNVTMFNPVLQQAWLGLSSQVAADGTVNGICTGTGILTSADAYNKRPTNYNVSAPGLGSVFRAAISYYRYCQVFQNMC
jgi:rhamnogalacturonyl hydrolase YesR